MQSSSGAEPSLAKARDQLDTLYQLSLLLNTGLDKETLATSLSLLETGVNPEALAAVLKELKKESII
jgi:mitotic-spindle organizing protein 1